MKVILLVALTLSVVLAQEATPNVTAPAQPNVTAPAQPAAPAPAQPAQPSEGMTAPMMPRRRSRQNLTTVVSSIGYGKQIVDTPDSEITIMVVHSRNMTLSEKQSSIVAPGQPQSQGSAQLQPSQSQGSAQLQPSQSQGSAQLQPSQSQGSAQLQPSQGSAQLQPPATAGAVVSSPATSNESLEAGLVEKMSRIQQFLQQQGAQNISLSDIMLLTPLDLVATTIRFVIPTRNPQQFLRGVMERGASSVVSYRFVPSIRSLEEAMSRSIEMATANAHMDAMRMLGALGKTSSQPAQVIDARVLSIKKHLRPSGEDFLQAAFRMIPQLVVGFLSKNTTSAIKPPVITHTPTVDAYVSTTLLQLK